MRIIRLMHEGKPAFAIADDQRLENAQLAEGELLDLKPTGRRIPIAPGDLLAPLIPADILCIGLNYRDHAAETGAQPPENPILFIKASNSLAGPNDPVPVPHNSGQVDFEAELAVVIARDARRVSRESALDHVLGYTVANDVSARDWQKEKRLNGGQFARGKSFDRFCPLGPAIVTRDEIPDPGNLAIRLTLNGQVMQDASTAAMIFDVPALIASLSETMTLRAGSIILTGTPAGVGVARKPPVYLKPGDVTEVTIERVGTLTTRFVGE